MLSVACVSGMCVFRAEQTCACVVGMSASHMCLCLQAYVSKSSSTCGFRRELVYLCVFEYVLVLVNFHPVFILGWLKCHSPALWIKADSSGEY